MLDLVVRLAVGVGISVVTVLVLLPVTVVLAKVFRLGIAGSVASRVLGSVGADDWELEVADKVETAVIGGLIGGVVFASLSPALAPVMYDLHVRSGVVEKPEPAVAVYELDVPQGAIEEQYNVSESGDYTVYAVELENADQRTLGNYDLNVRFPGCVEATSMGATNFDTALVTNQSREVQLGEFENRSANATCYGAVGIDEFPPGNSALVTFLVDENATTGPDGLYPEPEDPGTVLVATSYSWQYNGRSYYDGADPVVRSVRSPDTSRQ